MCTSYCKNTPFILENASGVIKVKNANKIDSYGFKCTSCNSKQLMKAALLNADTNCHVRNQFFRLKTKCTNPWFSHCSVVSGVIRERRSWEQHGEGQMEVSEVCINPCLPLYTQAHTFTPQGFPVFQTRPSPNIPLCLPADQADPSGM